MWKREEGKRKRLISRLSAWAANGFKCYQIHRMRLNLGPRASDTQILALLFSPPPSSRFPLSFPHPITRFCNFHLLDVSISNVTILSGATQQSFFFLSGYQNPNFAPGNSVSSFRHWIITYNPNIQFCILVCIWRGIVIQFWRMRYKNKSVMSFWESFAFLRKGTDDG